MAKDFFGSLGETLTKTARELSDRAEEVYETQRLKNKISGEERQITKAMADIGKIIYKRYRDGVPLAEEEKAICEQIDERRVQIDKYKEEMNGVKGSRFCPSCGNPFPSIYSFVMITWPMLSSFGISYMISSIYSSRIARSALAPVFFQSPEMQF